MNVTIMLLMLPQVFLLITTNVQCLRLKGDPMLEITNNRHAKRIFTERLLNSTIEERILSRNDLNEDSTEAQGMHQTPEVLIDFKVSPRRSSNINRPMDIMHYNDTFVPYTPVPIPDADILSDLKIFRNDKFLMSSKNALFITRKEYLKKDWCKSEPLIQRIREDGCLSRSIMNRFCYGQCNSFYIPKSPKRMRELKRLHNSLNEFQPEDLTEAAFRSCAFCKPKKLTWITLTLRCPSLVPPIRRKKIQRIKQCKCIAEPLD